MNCEVQTPDGNIGTVSDIYFDDATFEIKFIVSEGSIQSAGQSIMAPLLLVSRIDWDTGELTLTLTMERMMGRRLSG